MPEAIEFDPTDKGTLRPNAAPIQEQGSRGPKDGWDFPA
jgi:hypothetical protein